MTPTAFFGGLRVRLVFLMFLALLPLGLIALWQTFQVVEETAALTRDRLQGITTAASAEQTVKLERAVGAGISLGVVAQTADLGTCRQVMARFRDDNPAFSFAGFIPLSGVMECSSAGDSVIDFSDYPAFQDALDRAEIFIEINLNGAVSNRPVIIVNVPVFQDGALVGFASTSLPLDAVTAVDEEPLPDGFTLVGLASSGEVFDLGDRDDDPKAFMPRDVPAAMIEARAGTTFRAVDQSGQTRLYSAEMMLGDSYVVLGSWPVGGSLNNPAIWRALMPVSFAVVMWFASMLVAYFGLSRLVLRHVRDLRSAMRRFALGERSAAALKLQDAPNEFQDAQRAFNRMVLLITEAEARQLTDLHDKEVLLREVHHRVKNNLQMIASIMNLQARSARTDEAREVLDGLQRRVRGLAMLHRSLYTQTDTSQVDTRDLAAAVVSDSTAVIGDQALNTETDLASVMIYPDQAVPLSMWIAEALTNAIKYAGANDTGEKRIWVTLAHDGAGAVTLEVGNTVGDPDPEADDMRAQSTGLGTKLMMAFCRQLEGQVELSKDDGTHVLKLNFEVQGFDPEAEEGATDPTHAPA